MPGEVLQHLVEDDLRARIDASGVRPLGHWAVAGYVYCVLTAPDLDAVEQYHAHYGLVCHDVHRLIGLGDDPRLLSAAQRWAVIRVHIRRVWHA